MSNMSKAPALSKSPHQIHEKASTAGKEGTKERKSRAGTRSVTTLSTQQLIRKRANDREAQRAIRQRTKDHIDNLERRIAQLSSKDEKLNNALQRNAALEAEVANLRNQFYAGGTANVLGYNYGDEESSSPKSVTSTLSNGRLVGDLPLAQVDPLSGFTNQGSSVPVDSMGVAPQSNMIPPTGVMSGLDLTAAIPVLPTAPSSTSTSATFSQSEPWQDYPALARSNTSVSSPSSDDYSTDQGSWAPDEGMNAAAMTTGAIPGVESALPPSINFNFMIDANGRPITFYSNAINAPYSNEQMNQGDIQSQFPASTSLPQQQNMPLAAENPFISSPATTVDGIPIIPRHGPPIDVNTIVNPPPTLVNFLNQPSTYAWEIPIRTVQPTCDVDVILLTFMHKQRGLMIEGVPRLQIEGPKYPSITSLLNPRRGETSHPISKVLTDLLSSLPSLVSVPEKTATLFMMYLLLRVSPILLAKMDIITACFQPPACFLP